MKFFERFFGGAASELPNISFGRYSDTYRTSAQRKAFEAAVAAFEAGHYAEVYRSFFLFLKDDQQGNLKFWETSEGLQFEFLQGSKRITGIANEEKVEVEAKVAAITTTETNAQIGLFHALMTQNYTLQYGRFALDNDRHIVVKFNTHALDGSPYKLYDAFKEVAITADKMDDLLLDQFPYLQPIDNHHIEPLPPSEQETKYFYLQHWIQTTFQAVQQCEAHRPTLNRGYLLMALCYKLDYLLQPQGVIMETLERINREYFAHTSQSLLEKCQQVVAELKAISDRPKSLIIKELYKTTSTFGVTLPTQHLRIKNFIENEISNIDWYLASQQPDIALAVAEYVVGYSLFNYAMPEPDRALFHLFYQITAPSFFKKLGFSSNFYDPEKGIFNKNAIKNEVLSIVNPHRKRHPQLHPALESLQFEDLPTFARSFLFLIQNLNYNHS